MVNLTGVSFVILVNYIIIYDLLLAKYSIIVAVRHPALDLLPVQPALVHGHLERVMDVIVDAQRLELGFEFLNGPGSRVGDGHGAPAQR